MNDILTFESINFDFGLTNVFEIDYFVKEIEVIQYCQYYEYY